MLFTEGNIEATSFNSDGVLRFKPGNQFGLGD